MQTIKLHNGIEMPQMGYGVYQITPEECERCVSDALEVGYRMIDTAQAYWNEEGVGRAWKKSGIRREDLFLVSKVWISNYGDGQTMKSIEESLRKLQTEYIDLMLLHQPFCDRYGAYRDLEKAYKSGKLRAIGVSNFYPDHLVDLAANMEIAPMVNQVETHVFNQQVEARKYMDETGTRIMSWGPLVEGKNNFFHNRTLAEIGEKYNKSVAQTALRWLIQSGVIIIPKTTRKERMAENLSIFDFELDADDMKAIATMDEKHSFFIDHHDGQIRPNNPPQKSKLPHRLVMAIMNVMATIEIRMPTTTFVVSASPKTSVPTRMAVTGSKTPSTEALVAPMLRVAMASVAVDTMVGSTASPTRFSQAVWPVRPVVTPVSDNAILPRKTIVPTERA